MAVIGSPIRSSASIVGVLILSSSWILIRDAVDILAGRDAGAYQYRESQRATGRVDGVGSVHDLHVWTLTSGVLAMSCHVVADDELQPHRSAQRSQWHRARTVSNRSHDDSNRRSQRSAGSIRFLQLPFRRMGFTIIGKSNDASDPCINSLFRTRRSTAQVRKSGRPQSNRWPCSEIVRRFRGSPSSEEGTGSDVRATIVAGSGAFEIAQRFQCWRTLENGSR